MVIFFICFKFTIGLFEVEAYSVGLSMLCYEIFSLLALCYYYFFKLENKYKKFDQPLKISHKFGKFGFRCIKMIMVEWPTYLIYESLSFIVAMSGDQVHLAAYTLVDNIYWIVESILAGIAIFARTQLNISISSNKLSKFNKMLRKLFCSGCTSGLLTFTCLVFSYQTLFWINFFEDEDLRNIMFQIQWFLYILCIVQVIDTFFLTITKAFNYLGFLSITNLIEQILMVILAYYLCVIRNWKI